MSLPGLTLAVVIELCCENEVAVAERKYACLKNIHLAVTQMSLKCL